MTTDVLLGTDSDHLSPDPAAILGAACSLKRVWIDKVALETRLQLSQQLPGVDSVMREILRIATRFEVWACRNVDFKALDEVWPYLLEAEFGEACQRTLKIDALPKFDEEDCSSIACELRLPRSESPF